MGMRGPRVKLAGTTLTQGRKRWLRGGAQSLGDMACPGRHGWNKSRCVLIWQNKRWEEHREQL